MWLNYSKCLVKLLQTIQYEMIVTKDLVPENYNHYKFSLYKNNQQIVTTKSKVYYVANISHGIVKYTVMYIIISFTML